MAVFRDDLAMQAAQRWAEVPPEVQPLEKMLVAQGEDTELRAQRQKRIARLGAMASTAKAQALALEADASPKATATQEDVLGSVGFERIIGNSDLMGVDFLELAIALSRAVGRMRCGNVFATGVLVGPRLLITNHHVIDDSNKGDGWCLEMDYQQNATGDLMQVHCYKADPKLFFYTNEALDFTVIGVEPLSNHGRPIGSYPWVKLVAETGKTEVGDAINIIQHPSGGLKQIAFRENQVIAMSTEKPDFLDYTTDTEEGSSGSGCFNDQWELVAIHHSGVPETRDGTILTKSGQPWQRGGDPKDIHWIGNEGVRVSAVMRALMAATLPAAFAPLVTTMQTEEPPNPIELARMQWNGAEALRSASAAEQPATEQPATEQPDPRLEGGTMSTGSVSFQLPLTITVSLGGGAPVAVAAAPVVAQQPVPVALPAETGEESVVIDQDWKGRPGYLADFLGADQRVPMPTLTSAQLLLTAQVDPAFRAEGAQYPEYELKYWNYSVLMNKKYRTAWFSVANVDGDDRFALPPRKGDRWFADKRIPLNQQLDQTAFEHGMDRGHLTRREDAAWGRTQEIAVKSTNDTFHFANCSLQASMFNRGKDRWQGLEQFLLEQHAKKEKRRMVVMTGPVFDAKNPSYRNSMMSYSVPCPLQFWKVCVIVRQDGTLSATGFLLGQQEIADLPGFEAFDVAATQVTLEQLQTKTKLSFDQRLLDADHFAKTGKTAELEEFVAGEKVRVIKEDYSNIVV